ncbi:hypothetical protein GOBAR_AA00478 [Gossypium barbadense]|uniref:Uncharacterized protein n=1 Tax=Gossypium barbadense TaxID=3634 RepID=A0A2P5YWX2_GOSBA|nr:hypothetical protein GOBAR_AA00478 [Gossypium barbadense]
MHMVFHNQRNKMDILKVTEVTPTFNSPESMTEFHLPLTLYGIFWFKLSPIECLFFYQLNKLTSACFNSVILPKLKRSLSLTLVRYLSLADNLKWPPNEPKPIILYTLNDGFSLTVSHSDVDFNILSSSGVYEAAELHPLKPDLITSDVSASAIAVQALFSQIKAHHAILDGQTTTMFIKSWAYICKQGNDENSPLPPNFGRFVVKGLDGLDMLYLNQCWSDSDTSKKSLKIISVRGGGASDLITREDFKKLRERVLSKLSDSGKEVHLSTFVPSFAYVITCMVKKVAFGFTADCRPRLNPPVSQNYFGNCNRTKFEVAKARDFIDEIQFVFGVQKVSGMVKALMERWILEGMEKFLSFVLDVITDSKLQLITVTGPPRFDFGWGKPHKVVIVSTDKNGAFSMMNNFSWLFTRYVNVRFKGGMFGYN